MGAAALLRGRAALLGCLLALACFLAFAPALSAGFLLWDDADNLVTNPHWRGFGPAELRWMFTTLHLGPYQPLSWLSYALDFELAGLDPHAFHRTNLVLHAANAVLCFLCARALLRVRFPEANARAAIDLGAAAAAVLFALHPLRVESVAWVTERRDVLSGFFLLISLRAYVAHATGARGRGAYALALAAYVASLLAKATALGWPLVLLVLDVWVLGRGAGRERWREKLPFLVPALLFAAVALLGQAQMPGSMASWAEHGLLARCEQAAYGWLFYALQTLAVAGVRPIYELVLPLELSEPRFVAALVLAPLVLLAAWLARKRAPAPWPALAAYSLLAAPVLGFAQTGPQLVAARYSYLPGVALGLLGGAALAQLALARPRALAALWLAVLCGAAALGARTRADTRYWQGDRALWTRARELDPGSQVALRNLAPAVYAEARAARDPREKRARLDELLALCDEGRRLGLDPQLENARGSALAALAGLESDPARAAQLDEQALAALRGALELARAARSDPAVAESNLIALLVRLGRAGEALPLALDWSARSPDSAEAWAALGHVRTELGHAEPALATLGRALELDRELSGAWLDRGLVLAALGRAAEARAAFEEVLAVCRRLGASGLEHPDAVEARMQLERSPPAPAGPPMR